MKCKQKLYHQNDMFLLLTLEFWVNNKKVIASIGQHIDFLVARFLYFFPTKNWRKTWENMSFLKKGIIKFMNSNNWKEENYMTYCFQLLIQCLEWTIWIGKVCHSKITIIPHLVVYVFGGWDPMMHLSTFNYYSFQISIIC